MTQVDPDVLSRVRDRGISQVLHFTTNSGLVGILDSGRVLSRDRLATNKRLEFIAQPNCEDRLKDPEWTDYVSLSISEVNKWMFDRSKSWHRQHDVWWCVLAFEPSLLAHHGVHFVTTNNTYTETLRRGMGAGGLEALFAQQVVWGHYDTIARRTSATLTSQPTHNQAEALYPRYVDIAHLQAIYVAEPDLEDEVRTIQAMLARNDVAGASVRVETRPEVFQ